MSLRPAASAKIGFPTQVNCSYDERSAWKIFLKLCFWEKECLKKFRLMRGSGMPEISLYFLTIACVFCPRVEKRILNKWPNTSS